MAVLVLLGIASTMVVSNFNAVGVFSANASDDLVSSIGSIQSAYNSYQQDKSAVPTGLADSSFIPQYLFIPRPATGFDGTYGISGYVLAYMTGQASPNNGTYVCARANVNGNDSTFQAITKAAAKLSADKFFYNTSCPATANMTTPAGAATVYVTSWITRN